jgi:ATP-dependent DNA ligase
MSIEFYKVAFHDVPVEIRIFSACFHESSQSTACDLEREFMPGHASLVFRYACKMGLEGIVSKRLGLCYRSRRSLDWLKFKNPAASAVRREAEEEWR